MYFRRKVDSYLRQWKDKENRLPLIIKGARQIRENGIYCSFCK